MPAKPQLLSNATTLEALFPTYLYRTQLEGAEKPLLAEIEQVCRVMMVDDQAGISWCRRNNYPGYTSYASLNDLPWRFPVFKTLVKTLDRHVSAFAKALEFDLGGRKLRLDSLWVNVLPPGGVHTSHIHPHSVISGTLYISTPKGSSALKIEDPRLGFMMAAPPRKKTAARANRQFVFAEPQPGTVLLWESWLRHEVPVNNARQERISVSFNYSWL